MGKNYEILTTRQKALKINLAPKIYGSFAEIGAGQDVADWFFKAGASSGTIAKTISAYDMTFSDEIYGKEKSGRYVCESRLLRMLDKEYELMEERLSEERPDTNFFTLANTVEVLNFSKTNHGHGWLGVRFQLTPDAKPNDVVIHVWLHDNDKLLQHQVIGTIGVNLLYGCYFLHNDREAFLESLLDNLDTDRVDIDMCRMIGPDFRDLDNRILSLKLVRKGMTNAAMFGPDGQVLQPSEVLYKKNILALRSRFRPITNVNVDMLEKSKKLFEKEEDVNPDNVLVLSELTLSNLRVHSEGMIDEQDFMDRVDILCSMGHTVLISNYQEYYRLVEYFSRFTRKQKIGIVLGVYNLQDVFKEKFYTNLQGGILEAFGKLFGLNVKLYVYPAQMTDCEDFMDCDNFVIENKLHHLFQYLKSNNRLVDIKDANRNIMSIFSDKVVEMIGRGDEGWEAYVPPEVEDAVKDKCLFGWPCSMEEQSKAQKIKRKESKKREKQYRKAMKS